MQGHRFSSGKVLRHGVIVLLAVGATLSASAQFGLGWKQAMASHDLCCGPRGSFTGDQGAGGLHLPPELAAMTPAQFAPESTDSAPALSGPVATSPQTTPAAAAVAAAPDAGPLKFERTASGYDKVGFDLLASFEFVAPEYDPSTTNTPPPSGAHQIPAAVKALNQQKVSITGFMLPTKMEGGLVKEFLLVKDAMLCCYGAMPKINEWVVVRMTGKGVKALMDVPISFEGKLNVGEMYENGYLTGLYLLEGDRMADVNG